MAYAGNANSENYTNISKLFVALAAPEAIHAHNFKTLLSELGVAVTGPREIQIEAFVTKENLNKAIKVELQEIDTKYPQFIRITSKGAIQMKSNAKLLFTLIAIMLFTITSAFSQSGQSTTKTYSLGKLKPTDSQLKVKSGDFAPDFTLPSISGEKITLSQYRGRKNVILSFVPAAWTPVCSEQWPGYKMVKDTLDKNDTVLLGITVDNIPTLHAWTQHIGPLWFEVLSDFWPHGAVADKYGVLRSDGLSERALFFIDEKGIIRAIVVMDINKKPDVKVCFRDIDKLSK